MTKTADGSALAKKDLTHGQDGPRAHTCFGRKRNLLSEQRMDESNAGRRNELETELRAVQSALRFCHDALKD